MSLKSKDFFIRGTHQQFDFVLNKYQDALRAKAESKNSKPENLLKLDKWFHETLPKNIKKRGKDPHLTHDEIVQCMKYKLSHGTFKQKLKDLIQMNTPRVVMQETKKSFRALEKRNDLEAAISVLSSMKGVGPNFASAVLVAFDPERVALMSDECLMSMPEVDEVEYTMKEYNKMMVELTKCRDRLNSQGGSWSLHKVDMAVFSYYILREHKPELLKDMPDEDAPAPVVKKVDDAVAEPIDTNDEESNSAVSSEANSPEPEEPAPEAEPEKNGDNQLEPEPEKPAAPVEPEPVKNGDVDVPEENGHTTPEPEKHVEEEKENGVTAEEPAANKSPSGEKRPLEETDENVENDSKRVRGDDDSNEKNDDNDESKSPHKANLSGQLLVC